jgi:hypothetical protein
MVDFDRGVLDRAVHAFGLAVGPRAVRLGQPVLYGMIIAYAAEDMAAWRAVD